MQPGIGTGDVSHGAAGSADAGRGVADDFRDLDDDEITDEMHAQIQAQAIASHQQQQQYFSDPSTQQQRQVLPTQQQIPAQLQQPVETPDALPNPADPQSGRFRILGKTPEEVAALKFLAAESRAGRPINNLINLSGTQQQQAPPVAAAPVVQDAPPPVSQISTQIQQLEATLAEAQAKRDERSVMMDAEGFSLHQRAVDKAIMELSTLKVQLSVEQAEAVRQQQYQQQRSEEQARVDEWNAQLSKYPALADENHPFTTRVAATFWGMVDQGLLDQNDPRGIAKAIQIMETAGGNMPAVQNAPVQTQIPVTRYNTGNGGVASNTPQAVAMPSVEDIDEMSPAEYAKWREQTIASVHAQRGAPAPRL